MGRKKAPASATAGGGPHRDGSSAAHVRSVGEAYVKNLLLAADANMKLGEWQAARAQLTALLELPPAARELLITPAIMSTIRGRLARPEIACIGLCRKSRQADGRTLWVFEEVEARGHEAPVVGVQTDKRSVCPLVRTPPEVLEAALQLASVSASDVVADLGCGDGRLLLLAAKRGARAVGFDVNPWCIEHSRAAVRRAGCSDRVNVVSGDMFALEGHASFEAASVVYVYLIPKVIARLQPLLAYAVASGKRVVICAPTALQSVNHRARRARTGRDHLCSACACARVPRLPPADCSTGCHSERPGNLVSGLTPVAEAMGGLLRLYYKRV